MKDLAEELYERTKDMISDIALHVMDDHQIPHSEDQALRNMLNEYYTLWSRPNKKYHKNVKLERSFKSARELISRIETNNTDTLHNKKLSDPSRLATIVLFRSTLAYIFNKHWNINQEIIGGIFNRDRSNVYNMVSSTENNIWCYNKTDCFERRTIEYLFEEAGLESPFDFIPVN